MKKKSIIAFLGLCALGLASCGNGDAKTESGTATSTITTTNASNYYYVEDDVREYLLPFVDYDNVLPKIPSKKYSLEQETIDEQSDSKTYCKMDFDIKGNYVHSVSTQYAEDTLFETAETFTYSKDKTFLHLEIVDGEIIRWSRENYELEYGNDGYSNSLFKIKEFILAEKNNVYSPSIEQVDLNKKGEGTFDCTIKGKYKYSPEQPYTLEFSFKDGLFEGYRMTMGYEGKKHIEAIKFSYDTEFTKTYPDVSLYDLELMEYENYKNSNVDNNPLADEDKLVDMDNYRTYYQLLVYSFADGDGDGIGDFKGIVDNLDYLVDLGVEGLWLSPVLAATSYHSYDIEDYYHIRYEYEVTVDGVKYDFNYLLKECHKKNIKVLMDLVINHSSYYNEFNYLFDSWYSKDNRFGFPEFDFDKEIVRTVTKDIGEYWLDRGVDGFRLDAAMWIYNDGSDRHEKNYEFWNEWCKKMKEVKPDCYIIGEVLDENHDLAYDYAQAGFDSTFDFNALGTVISAVKDSTYDYASNTMANVNKALANNPNYILGRALSNHDIGRFNQSHPDSNDIAYYVETVEEIKLANALNALTPGNTFIYYGDELGLLGTATDTRPNYYYDMNYRTPMPFENERTDSVAYFEGFHGQGVTTSNTITDESISEILSDPNSIYNKLKEALALKNSSEVLQKGTLSTIEALEENLSGFDVTYNGKTIRVLYVSSNVSEDITLDITSELLYNLGANVNGSQITLNSCDLIAYQL